MVDCSVFLSSELTGWSYGLMAEYFSADNCVTRAALDSLLMLSWRAVTADSQYQLMHLGLWELHSHWWCDVPVSVIAETHLSHWCAFSYSSPTTWNSVPTSIKNCSSLYSFRHHLKSHLIAELLLTYSVRPLGDGPHLWFMLNAWLCVCYKFPSSYYYYYIIIVGITCGGTYCFRISLRATTIWWLHNVAVHL